MAGILPALVWLLFLLREDAKHPEPKRLILLTFLGGMLAVVLALPLERFACTYLGGCTANLSTSVFIAWAIIEETLKYAVTAAFILWRRDVDEPVDYVVYMLTAALGFSALENALFLIAPFSSGNMISGLLTENLRFVGSTLLHVVASSAIGFALAFGHAWNMRDNIRARRIMLFACGLILAIALHAVFNFLIISRDGSTTLAAFFTVWTGVLVFFALFEILRIYGRRRLPTLPY